MNPAVNFYREVLNRRRPAAREPERYVNTAHAFGALREHAHMSREEFAFKLGLSLPMVVKIEAGSYGGNPQLDTVDRARELAADYGLPSVAMFLKHIHTHLRTKPRRGPKPASRGDVWYYPEREGVT